MLYPGVQIKADVAWLKSLVENQNLPLEGVDGLEGLTQQKVGGLLSAHLDTQLAHLRVLFVSVQAGWALRSGCLHLNYRKCIFN